MKSNSEFPKKRKYLLIGGWLLLGCLLFILPLMAITADEILENLSRKQESFQDLQALIYQTIATGGKGGTERSYTARVFARKTEGSNWNRFYYEIIDPPSERLIQVYDGKFLWTYYPSLSQVTQQELESFPRGVEGLGIFPEGLSRDFSFRLLGEEKLGKEKFYYLEMIPRLKELESYRINLWVDSQQWIPRKLKVVDPQQVVTITQVKEIQFNRGLKEDLFHFLPPPGTEVTRITFPGKQ